MENYMKHIVLLLILVLLSSLLLSQSVTSNISQGTTQKNDRTTDGTLNFSVRTVTYGGRYAPRNSGVIWITNAANQFVKTIKVWAQPYRYTLIRWNASSGGNTTGAITGASLNNHQLHNVTWNWTNSQGVQVPDGEYKVNVEFTEHNATSSNMGKFKQITFTKGANPVTLTIPNETYFQNMSLIWTPIVVANSDELNPAAVLELLPGYPNPFEEQSNIRFKTDDTQLVELSILNLRGQKVLDRKLPPGKSEWTEFVWDGRNRWGERCPAGNYLVQLRQGSQIRTEKLQLLN